jgi:hypothetical protein
MTAHFRAVAFTDDVREAQERNGSRQVYARVEERRPDRGTPDRLTAAERAFVAERDHFYLATVGATGWPYVQHRGGPPGFLRVLDPGTLGWADFGGNVQYLSLGNLAGDPRVSLLLMDYAHRRRLKLLGRAREVDLEADRGLAARLVDPAYEAPVERGILVDVEAFDWNCPQHITPRYTAAELGAVLPPDCLALLDAS